jgi:hypothetical protein
VIELTAASVAADSRDTCRESWEVDAVEKTCRAKAVKAKVIGIHDQCKESRNANLDVPHLSALTDAPRMPSGDCLEIPNVSMLIRHETDSDCQGIRRLNQAAFESDTEADLVDALRESGSVEVSLVAEKNGEIVGHILFSRLPIITNDGAVAHAKADQDSVQQSFLFLRHFHTAAQYHADNILNTG